MKAIQGPIRQPNDGHAPQDHLRSELVISLPDFRLIRLIARSLLLVAAVLSLPWLRSVLISDFAANFICLGSDSVDDDELFYMPRLLQDMKAHGLIQPQGHSLFIGSPGLQDALLWRNGISCLPEHKISYISSAQSPDFVFIVAIKFNDADFRSIDRIIKVGGVIAFLLGAHSVKPFVLPANYRMIYIQNLGRTIIAVKKLYHDSTSDKEKPKRRLLSDSGTDKKDADQTPTDAINQKSRQYLKELIDESLKTHPRIGPLGRVGDEEYFTKKHQQINIEFEIVRAAENAGEHGDPREWLRKEEVVKGGVIGLIDEWLMKCRSNGEPPAEANKKWRKRVYWECLALFAKLREKGVAANQWWG